MGLRTIVVIEAIQDRTFLIAPWKGKGLSNLVNGCIERQLGFMTLGEAAKVHTPGYYTIIPTPVRRVTDPEKTGFPKAKQF